MFHSELSVQRRESVSFRRAVDYHRTRVTDAGTGNAAISLLLLLFTLAAVCKSVRFLGPVLIGLSAKRVTRILSVVYTAAVVVEM